MCGIFSILNNNLTYNINEIEKNFNLGKGRGPDDTEIKQITHSCIFGFHRLSINGLNSVSNQPLIINNVALICNGEIYNYKELYEMMGIIPNTGSDCEVIIHLYIKYGIEQTLQMLDGVFSFILCDYCIYKEECLIYIARDPYGVRPLYKLDKLNSLKLFASEIKVLNNFCESEEEIQHFEPGTYSEYILRYRGISKWELVKDIRYHRIGFNSNFNIEYNTILENIKSYFCKAIEKRVTVTEKPIACLLSGGLDSSLVTALVNEYHKQSSSTPLETFSIGLEDSVDLKYAKIVADYLGTKHTEIKLTEEDFINAIPEVIYAIESYDTTTVRASIGNYLLGKYIAQHSSAKVIFNGDGSDELAGGYLYMNLAPDAIEFDKETRRLLKDIHKYDVLRSDKSISSHGLEPRTPFLDRSFVQYYLSIDPKLRFHRLQDKCEKYLIREAFNETKFGKALLPKEVLYRPKEAFSDGVGNKKRTLFQIIPEYIKKKSVIKNNNYLHNPPKTEEELYYRNIFETYYPEISNKNLFPYMWLPKYVKSDDPSARSLYIYNLPTYN